jgi:hypothetical protein
MFHVKQPGGTLASTPIASGVATISAIARSGEAVGYFSNDAAVPAARRREGSVRARPSARRGPMVVS